MNWKGFPMPRLHVGILTLLISILLATSVFAAIRIAQDPNGFLDIPWGNSLKDRPDLHEIDNTSMVRIFTFKHDSPEIQGIPMESMKLYTLEGKFARAIFHYRGKTTHESLINFLETRFGKIEMAQGGMMRGLNQQYTWRGPETEITISYHGFRERGVLTAESRVLAPLFFDAYPGAH
jgi:hypothetical protein